MQFCRVGADHGQEEANNELEVNGQAVTDYRENNNFSEATNMKSTLIRLQI
jgi:hypothetical protein